MDKQDGHNKYYSVIKRNKALTPATTRMNLGSLTLSERSQSQKAACRMISFIWHAWDREVHSDRKQIRGCLGLGGRREMGITGTGFWGEGDGNVLKSFKVMVAQLCEYMKNHRSMHSTWISHMVY